MINRVIIRNKVVQTYYSYLLSRGEAGITPKWAEDMLRTSLDKTYELYMSMFQLMIDLTFIHSKDVDEAQYKPFAKEEDKKPNTRLVNNRLVEKIRQSEKFNHYILNIDGSISWLDDELHLRTMLGKILASDIYAQYLASPDSMKSDCDFWTNVIKNLLLEDELFLEKLETKCIHWVDNVDVVCSFVIKTLRQFSSQNDPVLDMYLSQQTKSLSFKDDIEDSDFGTDLLSRTIASEEANNALIDRHISASWDANRIATMDRVILNVAITEVKSYPKIPTPISINEYVELAKYYGSEKSAPFINGLLHSVISELKKNREIIKA